MTRMWKIKTAIKGNGFVRAECIYKFQKERKTWRIESSLFLAFLSPKPCCHFSFLSHRLGSYDCSRPSSSPVNEIPQRQPNETKEAKKEQPSGLCEKRLQSQVQLLSTAGIVPDMAKGLKKKPSDSLPFQWLLQEQCLLPCLEAEELDINRNPYSLWLTYGSPPIQEFCRSRCLGNQTCKLSPCLLTSDQSQNNAWLSPPINIWFVHVGCCFCIRYSK